MKSFVVILALVAVVAADVAHLRNPEADAEIIEQEADVLPDQYQYKFRTSNGIAAQESGVLKNAGREDEAMEVQGSNSYIGPDGITYETKYISDENGYRVEGAHIPVPPQIPEYILRSLEFIRSRTLAAEPRP